ncbi:hypothetical protein ACP49_16255 [Clostridium botulinum]|nr:hypothetical protein ACP53_11430 [Clostridium botulinum]KOM99502.1 hypothetical protein ACP49_16255 [Clostridium botulinum]NFH94520.1 hypothetical protein [Clostridium botulinum]NFH97397.1 hypothetical protein [Clostridium botulinum]NFI25338.1 hypothetical protein [Clostridium botulinum]
MLNTLGQNNPNIVKYILGGGNMERDELIKIILRALKSDEENNTNEFWDKMNNVGCTKLMLAQTINYLIDHKMISGSKQEIGMKGDPSFVTGLNITPIGLQYLKENSLPKKVFKVAKDIKDFIK